MTNNNCRPAFRALSTALALLALGVGLTGCQTAPSVASEQAAAATAPVINVGDQVKVTFPGAPNANLDAVQSVRMDGKINLVMGGEIQAAGKTPAELEKDIVAKVGSQLVDPSVNVTVVQSTYAVYVTGAVLKPGKINPANAITIVEAIMEAGYVDAARANLKSVRIIREGSDGRSSKIIVNVQAMMDGKAEPFYLRNKDMVIVDEKFVWF